MAGQYTEFGLPDNAVILHELHVVEFLDEDGDLYTQDISRSSVDGDLQPGKALELVEYARAQYTHWMLYDAVHDYIYYEGDDEEGEEGE